MEGNRHKLTKRIVDAANVPAIGEGRIWDADLAGFCLRIYSSGRKVYALKFRIGRRQRWLTIGEHGKPWEGGRTLTPDQARKAAEKAIGAARGGVDPTQAARDDRDAITVAELIGRYLTEGPATRPAKRLSSWNADRGNLNHHVLPLLGNRLVNEVTRSDVAKMLSGIIAGDTAREPVKTKTRGRARVRGGAGIAQRALAATSAMFSWGIEQGVGRDNPAKGIRLPRRPALERFLSSDEARHLLRCLSEAEKNNLIPVAHGAAIRLLLLTGARKGEIVGLDWSEIDFGRSRVTLPPARTKAGAKTGERRIALSPAAVAVLLDIEPEASKRHGWVFPAKRGTGHTTELQKSWETLRNAAGLPNVRIHDLRHSFASFAIADGASLYMVAKALGHADTRTSERYAHITDDPVQALADRAAERIMGGITS